MPLGTGGFHTIGTLEFTSTYTRSMFKASSSKQQALRIESLRTMFMNYFPAECFMCDGGSHFKNKAVCENRGAETKVVSVFVVVNGLVEGTNKILLHVLKRLCCPNLSEGE